MPKEEKGKKRGSNTKRLAVCAMLAALGTVFLYAGSLIEVVDITMAVVASLLCVVAVIEYGGAAPWAIFAVTSVLSLLLLPNKTPAAYYAVFFGFYPILKEKLEKLPRVLSWVLKEIVFNVCFVVMIVLLLTLFLTDSDNALLRNPYVIGIGILLGEAVFVVYDIALTRLISFYILHLRKRMRF